MPAPEPKGRLYGIGVGPGDPELLTLKAARAITESPVIAFPATDSGLSMARDIASPHIGSGKIELPVAIPITRPGEEGEEARKQAYDRGRDDIMGHLDAGRDVALLCEGDPFFYGSFSYVFFRLYHDYDIEIIPGIPSPLAAAAMIPTPLALGNTRLAILPAPLPLETLEATVKEAEAIIFIKLGRHKDKICQLLKKTGLYETALYAEYVTMKEQKIRPLIETEALPAPYFSMILVHKAQITS